MAPKLLCMLLGPRLRDSDNAALGSLFRAELALPRAHSSFGNHAGKYDENPQGVFCGATKQVTAGCSHMLRYPARACGHGQCAQEYLWRAEHWFAVECDGAGFSTRDTVTCSGLAQPMRLPARCHSDTDIGEQDQSQRETVNGPSP
ncbi:MAG: hypothetical protein ACPIOQ_11345 [Promethearchaeia archaeon]